MRGRHIGALVGLIGVLAAAMLTYVRTHPLISDDDLREAREEVARVHASLHEAECFRPAIFDLSAEAAMPLQDFFDLEGPLAECWEAGHCSTLPEELARQAATPDRCAPTIASPEDRMYDSRIITERHPILRRVRLEVQHGEKSNDDRFRLLVQGMAVGRDLTQGPTAGFAQAQWGARIETELGAEFAAQFGVRTPSAEARVELDRALGVLAAMPIDANTFLTDDALRNAEMFQAAASSEGSMFDGEDLDWRVYASAMVASGLQAWCPLGGSVEECISHLPTTPPPLPSGLRREVLGQWVYRREIIEHAIFSGVRSYADELRALEGLRHGARALQELLRLSGERAEGRCPEISPWTQEESGDRIYVDRSGEHLYQVVAPGGEQSFVFRCPVRPAP